MTAIPEVNPLRDTLLGKIEDRSILIGVVGLGYVGLPLCRAFLSQGIQVIGLDVDPAKVAQIGRGSSPLPSVFPDDELCVYRNCNHFAATVMPEHLEQADAIVICVPTPLTPQREPDLQYVRATADSIKNILEGKLIVLQSTTYPGTTREVFWPLLRDQNLVLGLDTMIAFSPEREDPGHPDHSVTKVTKIVGADDPDSLAVAERLYSRITKVHTAESTDVAEAAKLLENIFRGVNIALVNELKVCFDRMGIDVWEVIKAASTKPFGFMPFYPGPGLGGHCLSACETVHVIADGKLQKIPIADFYEKIWSPAKTIYALSYNTEAEILQWKRVTDASKREAVAPLVEIRTASGLVVRSSDKHPFLLMDNEAAIRPEPKWAKDLQVGNYLPISSAPYPDAPEGSVPSHYTLPSVPSPGSTAPDRIVYIGECPPSTVYSIEVDDNHNFVTTGGLLVHNCIPLDPFYLTWKARQFDTATRFIELAGEINTAMPDHVVAKVTEALNHQGLPVKGSHILLIGIAYKKNVADTRESPAFAIADRLSKLGANLQFHDPHVEHTSWNTHRFGEIQIPRMNLGKNQGKWLRDAIQCAVIITDHDAVDYPWLAAHLPCIVDTRNAMDGIDAPNCHIVKA